MKRPIPLPFAEGFCYGLTVGLLVMLLIFTSVAHAETSLKWRRIAEPDAVAITVTVLTRKEMAAAVKSRDFARAYSQLMRNKTTGAWSCHIYVLADSSDETLNHEKRHCAGWIHQ